MTTRNNRLVRAAVACAALGGVAACSTVPGTGSTDPSDVAAYSSTIAASKSAAAKAAGTSACTSWNAGFTPRARATSAMIDFTKNPGWDWGTIAPTLNANLAAISTESGKLPSVIETAEPNETIHSLLLEYRTKLDAYGAALRADSAARGEGTRTWPTANAANSTLSDVARSLLRACS